MNKSFIFSGFLLLFFLSFFGLGTAVISGPQSISLLSVSQLDNGSFVGGLASMSLEIKPGSGSIFFESYPVSKVDTQIATRIANEVACEFSDVDCSKFDFFYTIRANSPLIGGPSGGGATAVLTLASLENVFLRDDFAMTGSILSGGIIGPVDGLREKISAAKSVGKSFVIIPFLSVLNSSENISKNNDSIEITKIVLSNESINNSLAEPLSFKDLNSFNISVFPVISLFDALSLASGEKFSLKNKPFVADKEYSRIMKNISLNLCNRSVFLRDRLDSVSDDSFLKDPIFNKSMSFLNDSSSINDSFYTRASLCFSANIGFQKLFLDSLENKVLLDNKKSLKHSIEEFSSAVNSFSLDSMSDLESFVIVNERLSEAREYLSLINDSNISSSLLASAIERYKSAVAWSSFFDFKGSKQVHIDNDYLFSACNSELESVEDRLNYLRLIVPNSFLSSIKNDLDLVYDYRSKNLFAQCLFKATKVKADENLLLSSLMVDKDGLNTLINAKLDRSKDLILSQKDLFPILGFSYFDYSKFFLQKKDYYSALLFSEYSLAFSDISKYFPPKKSFFGLNFNNFHGFGLFFFGFISGIIFFIILFPPNRKKRVK